MKSEVLVFLEKENIPHQDTGEYIELTDRNVRIYTVDDAWEYRANYFGDTGGYKKDHFQQISIANEKNGIRTIWVKPWEFEAGSSKRGVIESIIRTSAGLISTTFNGRDTVVKEIKSKDLREFLNENSFYGFRGASISLGLFLKKDVGEYKKDTLLMVYTFGHPFFGGKKNKYDLEVIRAATLKNVQVRGGASKLFKYLVDNHSTVTINGIEREWKTIVYYVDYDHNSGNSLPHLGFNFVGYAAPGFMNVTRATGKATHREPARHAEIMRKIKEGEMFSVFNAGVKVYTFEKGVTPGEDSTFIAE